MTSGSLGPRSTSDGDTGHKMWCPAKLRLQGLAACGNRAEDAPAGAGESIGSGSVLRLQVARLLGFSVTLVISVSDAATSRRASCDSVRGRPARDGAPVTPPPRGPSIRSVCDTSRRGRQRSSHKYAVRTRRKRTPRPQSARDGYGESGSSHQAPQLTT